MLMLMSDLLRVWFIEVNSHGAATREVSFGGED